MSNERFWLYENKLNNLIFISIVSFSVFFLPIKNVISESVFNSSSITTLIPIRSFFNFIGYEVIWIPEENLVKISKDDITYYFSKNYTIKKDNVYPMEIINETSFMNYIYLKDFNYIIPEINDINIKKMLISGDHAPQIDSKTIEKTNFNSFEYLGRSKVVLVFWASWCPYCNEILKNINDIQGQFENTVFITINIDESFDSMSNYIIKNDYNIPVIFDDSKHFFNEYNPRVLPTTYLIDSNGYINERFEGNYDFSKEITNWIDK